MGTQGIRLLAGAFIVALGWVYPAAAQIPRTTISGGYQFVNLSAGSAGGGSESFDAGWFADIGGNLARDFAVVCHVGGSYKTINQAGSFEDLSLTLNSDFSIYQFMGGVRATAHPAAAAVKPFGHLLVGALRIGVNANATMSGAGLDGSASGSVSETKTAIQVGGGVDFMMTDRLGVRAGADYSHAFGTVLGVDGGLELFRFAAGAVLSF